MARRRKKRQSSNRVQDPDKNNKPSANGKNSSKTANPDTQTKSRIPITSISGWNYKEKGQGITLEVELSYAAGTMATAAAVAWYTYDYVRTIGFATIADLLGSLYVLTLLEGFVAGLALFLVYRGVELAVRLKGRGAAQGLPPATESSLQDLNQVGSAVFYYTFRYLLRALLFGIFILAAVVSTNENTGASIPAALLVGLGLLLHYPGLYTDRVTPLVARIRAMSRWLGIWWVEPPRVGKSRTRYRIVALVGSLSLLTMTLQSVLDATLTADRDVYVRSAGDYVTLHYYQGGLRGHGDSEITWAVDSDLEVPITFERMAINHHVAYIPSTELSPGMHYVKAGMNVRERLSDVGSSDPASDSNAHWELRSDATEVWFLVVP